MDRADKLLHQMTIEEKAMQLSALYPMGLLGADGPIKGQLEAQVGQGIGHICGLGLLGRKSPGTIAKTVNAIQRYLVTSTRPKIPAIFHNEALNGVGVGWAQTRQLAAASAEDIGALALAAGMDVELPMVHGYGKVLAKAVRSGKVSESQLNESVRCVLRDKFALGLFDNPCVAEDPIKLESLTTEGKDLSQRLAAESVTLLNNEKGLLPLGRDVKKIAIIGPHADSAAIGFAAYTYPAALRMLQGMLGGGETSMAGVGDSGDSTWLPAEAKTALVNELKDYLKVDLADYVKRSYPAVSLAEAVRQLLPDAKGADGHPRRARRSERRRRGHPLRWRPCCVGR